ncbi:MAG: AraC family transcriptional regulator [Spirochaetaceae bacterium]
MNSKIVNEYEGHVKKTHLVQLKKTQEILESFVEDIKWSTYQIGNNTKILRLISDQHSQLSIMERSLLIRETMDELSQSLLYNTSFNSTFYIYLKNQDMIITPYSVYSHSDFNRSFTFFKMDNISSEDWHSYISNKYLPGKILKARNTIIEDFKNKKMIPYVQSLPLNKTLNNDTIEGAIVYLIGETDFNRFLDYKSIPAGGYSYIADDDNNIISSVSNSTKQIIPIDLKEDEGLIDLEIDGEKMFVIYTTSSKNSWKYVSVLPEKWVLTKVTFYQFTSILVMSIALIFCLFVAYKLSQIWSKPITSSIKTLGDFLNSEKDEEQSFKTLNLHVNELVDQSEGMLNELLSQKVFVHNAFVNRLVNGFFKDKKGLDSYLSHLGFNLTENSFSVAIISFSGSEMEGSTEYFDNQNKIKNILKSKIQSEFPMRIMVSEQENSDIVLILMTDNLTKHKKIVRTSLNNFFNDIPSTYKNNLIIGLGDTVKSLMNINKSFIQAIDILSIPTNDKGLLIMDTKSVDKKIEEFYYTIEVESRLINTIKSGNIENTESLIEMIYSENLNNRQLDSSNLKAFYFNLKNTFNRIINQVNSNIKQDMEIELNKIDESDFVSIKALFIQISTLQHRNKRSHNNLLSEEIKDFLMNNYQDKNLGLYSVADHFSITESYLSFFFKEQTDINFSTYLEQLRVSEAQTLLTTSNETIQSIAYKIGYNSDKTFRRVFQKNLNMSPSKYRLNNKL